MIPSNTYQPFATTVPLRIEVNDLEVAISLPRWNTYSLQSGKRGTQIARASIFQINASYRYSAEVHADNVDLLHMGIMVSIDG